MGDKKKVRVKTRLSESARTTLHPLTRIPKRVVEINLFPSVLKEGAVLLTKKNARKVFKNFLAENQEFFGVKTENLELISARKINGNWYANFQQSYEGIPVYQATVGLVASAQGKVNTYVSNYHPRLEVPTTPKISLKQAVQIAKRTYDQTKAKKLREQEISGIIFPERKRRGMIYHLAWKFLLAGERPEPALDKYFIIDAIEGKILLSYNARFPGARVSGQVQARIYPENPNAPPVTTMPVQHEYVNIRYAGRATTRSTGRYSKRIPFWWEIFGVRAHVTFRLKGPYAQVQDSDGSDFEVARRCRTTNPCNQTWTAADLDHCNVFYHMNLLHDWYREQLGHNWINAWDGTRQFKAEVNHTFANAYAGSPMLFGTDPFARSSDVIYHECTHNVIYQIYGDYIGWPAGYSEGYAMDEGFADYFAGSFTGDSRHGEGYGGTRDLDNNEQYPGKDTYNIEGHTGGQIIGGAAWDLRERLISVMGPQGALFTDRLILDALQILATYPRDYYFSDPQESNLLSAIYMADDDNNNLVDGVPHFIHIHQAFANHNLLQAILFDQDSFDFSANIIDEVTGGDLYYYDGKFWANNSGQRGVRDLGDIGNVALRDVLIPRGGYTRSGVSAVVGHTYVSRAHQGEEGNYIVFRVTSISADKSEVTIEYYYRQS